MGSSVAVSLSFPVTEDTGEGTRDVRGGVGAREPMRERRLRLLRALLLESSVQQHSLSSRLHAEVCL